MTDDATHQDADGNPTYPGHRESRLSHDRGADAEPAPLVGDVPAGVLGYDPMTGEYVLTERLGPDEFGASSLLYRFSVPAPTARCAECGGDWPCAAARYGDHVDQHVPAPTLPALDAALRTLTDNTRTDRIAVWQRGVGWLDDDETISVLREALRDAVSPGTWTCTQNDDGTWTCRVRDAV